MAFEPSFPRYLSAKKSVDDRALNARVWQRLKEETAARTARSGQPLRLLEAGSGIGTMLERMLAAGLLSRARVTALDASAENSQAACLRLSAWGGEHGWAVREMPGILELTRQADCVQIEFVTADIYEFLAGRPAGRTWDLLVANAFLDLFHLPDILTALLPALPPGGLAYFSINFDGLTAFEPVWDAVLEEQILALYHRTMDERLSGGRPSGDSRSGRHLFGALSESGLDLLEAGSSDWVVFPKAGKYPGDEAYFLEYIIHTIAQALSGHPEVDGQALAAWTARRFAQAASGQLVYVAHQLDVLAARPG